MFNRFSIKQLLVTLGILAGLYLISMAMGGGKKATFNKTLSALDTAQVSQVLIETPDKGTVQLVRNGAQWQVKLDNGSFASTGDDMVSRALEQIAFLEANQLVSRKESQWGEYKVDSSGTQVTVMQGQEKVLDLMLGRFEYKQTGMTSYVRPVADDETYMVNGFLDAAFNRAAADWRNKQLINSGQNAWSQVSVMYPEGTLQMIKGGDNTWRQADSTALNDAGVSAFLGTLSNISGSEFVERTPGNPTPEKQLLIQTASGPVEIKAYADAEEEYLISSSQNPGAFFSGKAGGLSGRLFVELEKLLIESSSE
ncbi:MAG: DUF4340 domain-containing protein [Bacteroidota bacterium]